jgi:hypothetical protein
LSNSLCFESAEGGLTMAVPESNTEQPGTAAWRVIEPHWKVVSIYDGPISFLEGLERLPESAQHLLAIWWCDAEVCNGGFHQFFLNSTGVLAPEAFEGFQAVGLDEFAKLAEAAISKFDVPYPRDSVTRCNVLSTLENPGKRREQWDPFFELDNRYYSAKEKSAFYECLDEYALRHA